MGKMIIVTTMIDEYLVANRLMSKPNTVQPDRIIVVEGALDIRDEAIDIGSAL